jgi:hypothetical protein
MSWPGARGWLFDSLLRDCRLGALRWFRCMMRHEEDRRDSRNHLQGGACKVHQDSEELDGRH